MRNLCTRYGKRRTKMKDKTPERTSRSVEGMHNAPPDYSTEPARRENYRFR